MRRSELFRGQTGDRSHISTAVITQGKEQKHRSSLWRNLSTHSGVSRFTLKLPFSSGLNLHLKKAEKRKFLPLYSLPAHKMEATLSALLYESTFEQNQATYN